MSEELRSTLTQAHWEKTKGNLRAAVVMRGGQRATSPPRTATEDDQRHAGWQRFFDMTEKFIDDVENEGWNE